MHFSNILLSLCTMQQKCDVSLNDAAVRGTAINFNLWTASIPPFQWCWECWWYMMLMGAVGNFIYGCNKINNLEVAMLMNQLWCQRPNDQEVLSFWHSWIKNDYPPPQTHKLRKNIHDLERPFSLQLFEVCASKIGSPGTKSVGQRINNGVGNHMIRGQMLPPTLMPKIIIA